MSQLRVCGLTREPWWQEVDLELGSGELAVLQGPSGSGKTLFLRALADLDPVDAGEVFLDGQPRTELRAPAWRRAVRYVHQGAPRLPGTVQQNVEAIASTLEVEASPVPGLRPDAEASQLSGGEAQRLALHRSLLGAPRVLLLDEVTAALDEAASDEAEARVLAFAREGGAVLWVSHDPGLATRLGAREVGLT